MSYEPYPPPAPKTAYEPTAVQLARAAQLKRHNRLYYLVPIVLLLLIVTLTGIALLAVALVPPANDNYRTLISGVADMIILTTAVMLTPLCLVLPVGAVALYFYDKEREHTRLESLQRLLWRVDNQVDKVRENTAVYTHKATKPVIWFNSYLTAVRHSLHRLKQLLFGG